MNYPQQPAESQSELDLNYCLDSFRGFVPLKHTNRRYQAINVIREYFRQFIQSVNRKKNIPFRPDSNYYGRLHTFGSFRVGVYTWDADVDILLVGPNHVSREEFFASFPKTLKALNEVEYVISLEHAYVPVIRAKVSGIEVDILFASLDFEDIYNSDRATSIENIQNLDLRCVRSLNGARVTEMILKSVDDYSVFKKVLQAVKLWAKRRCIYSNVLGYFGGVSWAMLVARICKLNPNQPIDTLVKFFFKEYSQWHWPNPVLLDNSKYEPVKLDEELWELSNNWTESTFLMPVITPSFPPQNSTFNVTLSTRNRILIELHTALEVCVRIERGEFGWSKLFEPLNFFAQYPWFICVSSTSQPEWVGLIESKLRAFVIGLERRYDFRLAVINPQRYRRLNHEGVIETFWVIGADLCLPSFFNDCEFKEYREIFATSVQTTATYTNVFDRTDMTLAMNLFNQHEMECYLREGNYRSYTFHSYSRQRPWIRRARTNRFEHNRPTNNHQNNNYNSKNNNSKNNNSKNNNRFDHHNKLHKSNKNNHHPHPDNQLARC